jgi:hypothetical protein
MACDRGFVDNERRCERHLVADGMEKSKLFRQETLCHPHLRGKQRSAIANDRTSRLPDKEQYENKPFTRVYLTDEATVDIKNKTCHHQ